MGADGMGEHTEVSALSLCSIFILQRSIPFVQGAFRDPETPDDAETIPLSRAWRTRLEARKVEGQARERPRRTQRIPFDL